jgi:hypothetical protein
MGIRLGAEIMLSDTFALRLGVDQSMMRDYFIYKVDGKIENEDDAVGSKDNPWYSQTGINAGFGVAADAAEFNLGIRYEIQGNMPKDDYYTSISTGFLKIITDIKFYL